MNELEKAIDEIDRLLEDVSWNDTREAFWELICDKARIGDMLENMPNATEIKKLAKETYCVRQFINYHVRVYDNLYSNAKEALESLKPKEPELLSCPFDGSLPYLLDQDSRYKYRCSQCDASPYEKSCITKEEAMKIWNTRK